MIKCKQNFTFIQKYVIINKQSKRTKGGKNEYRTTEKHIWGGETGALSLFQGYDKINHYAFTLAEVLITIAILGVVAAMTIPTLVSKFQEKGWNTSATVFEGRLKESLTDMYSQRALTGYSSTKDFVIALSKHLKITKVCSNSDLLSCFEDKVFWGGGDANPKKIDMANIKTAKNFGQNDWDTELIGIQLANGINGLIAYNPNCDTTSDNITVESCLALLYDTTGFSKPNTSGKDLRSINVSKLGGACAFEIEGTCYGTPFYPTPLTYAECKAQKDDLGINACYYTTDYWAGAVAACGGVDKMPSQAQLAEIASYIYGTTVKSSGSTYATRDDDKASALGFDITSRSCFSVWSGVAYSDSDAHGRVFCPTYTHRGSSPLVRGYSYLQAVCLGD